VSYYWELYALISGKRKEKEKKACKKIPLSTIQVESEQGTVHPSHQTQLEKKDPPCHSPFTHKKKKGGPFTPRYMTSHWLQGNYIPKIGCHYSWSRLKALPKNSLAMY